MPRNIISMIILGLVATTTSKPVTKRQGNNFDRVEELTRLYPSIVWETAASQCTVDDFNMIAEAVRVANDDMLQPIGRQGPDEIVHTPAFNRFFIRPDSFDVPFQNNWGSTESLAVTFTLIKDIFRELPLFMKPRGEIPRRRSRIKYLCQPWEGSSCREGVGAKTYDRIWDEKDPGPSTVFCPLFFNKAGGKFKDRGYRYIQDIAKDKNWQPTDLPQIHSREQAVIHELCHVDLATGRASQSHIRDLKDTVPGEDGVVDIYGASRAHNFAWKNVIPRDREARTVNPLTAISADNFALVYISKWMGVRFNWVEDGAEPLNVLEGDNDFVFEDILRTKDPNGEQDQALPDFTTMTMPPNCFFTSDNTTDVYNTYCANTRGLTGDEWIAARDEPMDSDGGCELSSQCKMPFMPSMAIDPKCSCKCDGEVTPLGDARCAGFEGALPDNDSPPNGAPPPS